MVIQCSLPTAAVPHQSSINVQAIERQVQDRLQHTLNTILPHLHGLESLIQEAPRLDTAELRELDDVLRRLAQARQLGMTNSGPSDLVPQQTPSSHSKQVRQAALPTHAVPRQHKRVLPPSPEAKQKRHRSGGIF